MASLNIECSVVPGPIFPSEINESVQMNAPICVILSSDDAFSSKFSKMVDNCKRVEISTLRIGKQGVPCLESKRRHSSLLHISNGSKSGTLNVIVPDGPRPGSNEL